MIEGQVIPMETSDPMNHPNIGDYSTRLMDRLRWVKLFILLPSPT